MTVRSLIVRGAGAGAEAVAGLVAFLFALIFAEPLVGQAIDYESARDEASDALARAAGQSTEAAGPDIFSRGEQSTIGIGVGIVALGVAFGLLLALAYALAQGRIVNFRPRTTAMLLAGGGFATLYLVPGLKYPANPPSIGHEDAIGDRSGLYLIMVVCSVAFAFGAVALGRRLAPRLGNWNASLLAGLGFVVLIGIVMAILPSLGQLAANVVDYGAQATETPQPLTDPAGQIVFPGFDADLLYQFRLYSVLDQALLWGLLGLGFGALAERLQSSRDSTTTATSSPTAAEVG